MTSLPTINLPQGEKLSEPLAIISTWALIGILGYAIALFIIELLPQHTPGAAVIKPLSTTAAPAQSQVSSAQQIIDTHLFGLAIAPPTTDGTQPAKESPKSRLNVKLSGIMATNDPKTGHALIGGGRKDTVVAVGEKIERATLEEVYALYIIINNNGKRERIELPKPKLVGLGPVKGKKTKPSTSRSTSSKRSSSKSNTVDMSKLPQTAGALRDYMVRNPSTMQQLMDVRPFRKNGRVVGYKLSPKQDDSLMRNFGVEPGDVVVALNGVKLDNQRRGLKALRQLVTAQQLDMTVLRNGAEIPINISLQ